MKNLKFLLLLASIFCFISTQAQNNPGKKIEVRLNGRTSFFKVDDKYNILKDTIFHGNDGFRVYDGYDTTKDNSDVEYVVLRYPSWANEKKQKTGQKKVQPEIDPAWILSMNKLFDKDPTKLKIYQEVLDSLKSIYAKKQTEKPVHVDIAGRSGLKLAMLKTDFENMKKEGKMDDLYTLKWKYSTELASGFMSIPFKLRPKEDTVNFNMTTDITLGAYIGVKKRISRRGNNFLIIPATLGLSYINVGNSETSNVNTENNSSVVPGWTWSSGLVFDLNAFNIGFVFGQDFASGVGDDWLYNKKMWYSFSIGYSFFSK